MAVSLIPEPGMSVASWVAADTTVVNTTTETTLCTLTIPKTAKAGDLLEFIAAGDQLNNSGASVNQLVKLKIGATTALVSNSAAVSASGIRRIWNMRVMILVESTSAQRVFGRLGITTASAVTWQAFSFGDDGYGTAAEDLTAGKSLVLSVTYSVAASTIDMVLHAAALTHVRS